MTRTTGDGSRTTRDGSWTTRDGSGATGDGSCWPRTVIPNTATTVIPAEAGISPRNHLRDSRLRGNDGINTTRGAR